MHDTKNVIISIFVFVLVLLLPFSTYAESYTYDVTGRLTSVTYEDGNSITYNYDATGNLLTRTVDSLPTLAKAIAILQVLANTSPPNPIKATADLNGDRTIGLAEVISLFQNLSLHD